MVDLRVEAVLGGETCLDRTLPAYRQWTLFPTLVSLISYLLNAGFNKGKAGPYSITKRSVPELIPVLGIQPAGDNNNNHLTASFPGQPG